jgi:prophage regulatory protein
MRAGDRVVWKQDDVSEWISARIAEGDAALIALNPITPAHLRLINALAKAFVAEHLPAPPATHRACAARDDVKNCVAANASATAPEASVIIGTVFLTFAQVSAKVSVGRTSIYAGIAAKPPIFPMPVKIGKRSLWVESEVESWMQERIAERDSAGL